MTAQTGFSPGRPNVVSTTGTTKNAVTITSSGQEEFELPVVPPIPSLVYMSVNGVDYFPPDITVVGKDVTWSGPFSLDITDKVLIIY